MKLPVAPAQYSRDDQSNLRTRLQEADDKNVKKDETWEPRRIVFTDTATGDRYTLTVASGVLKLTLL